MPDSIPNSAIAELKQKLSEGQPALPAFRNTLKQAQVAIQQQFQAGADAAQLVRTRATLIDHILQLVWHKHLGSEEKNIALIAVGGYGRGELHPCSDIDILILLRSAQHEEYREALEQLIMFLWDIGLEVGQSVRSIEECVSEAKADITVATNLIESRLLTGPEVLFSQLRQETGPNKIWSSREYFEGKLEEQTKRHLKYNESSYNLEPNVKEGPGGLRDIQMIGWVAKRHFNAETLYDLVKHNFLTEEEYQQLIERQNFLWRVRFALHNLTKRHEDRLLFDFQRTIAEHFGYRDEDANLAVEHFMKDYYRTILELNRLNEILLQHFQEAIIYANELGEPVKLNKRFQTSKGFIEVTHENVFKHYPFALLEIFLLLEQNSNIKGIRASTLRLLLSHHHLIDDTFRQDIRNRSLFMEILRQPVGITHQLRHMKRFGILARYLPEFGKISGLMQYDLFHIYTVDEHTLMVIRNIRRLMLEKHEDELPFCSKVMQHIAKPELLYIAGLYHDIAKGRGGDHSKLGAVDARNFCINHDLNDYDTELVCWLVSSHLLMSATAQRKDISDPDIIAEFAAEVGDIARLNYLYILTVSDMRATNNTIWNGWKDSLLRELHTTTRRALRQGYALNQSEKSFAIKNKTRRELDKQHVDPDKVERLWASLGDDYFVRHTVEEIVWHSEAIIENEGRDFPLILVQQHLKRGGTEIFIHMPNKDHLFATTTRALDQLSLNVHDARIITSDKGYTFDTYVVMEENGNTISSSHRIEDILRSLKRELKANDFITKEVTRRSARRLKHFDTKTCLSFNIDKRNHRTVMELITADRPGLLSIIGQSLMECNIDLQNAKIATIGERVEDVFFITDAEGNPLSDKECLERIRLNIINALD